MSKDPAFLFYPNDWLGGTMGMTAEQKGAYIDLLVFQFNHLGHFTESEAKQVLSICFASVWQVVKNKFKTEGENNEFLYNERLREEIEKRQSFSESRRINALHDKKPREKKISKSKAYAKHMGNENEDINKDIIKNKYLDSVLLTDPEYQKLITKYTKDLTDKAIEILNNAIMSKGYKYKSHYHTLIGWPMKEAQGGNYGIKQRGISDGGYRLPKEYTGESKPTDTEIARNQEAVRKLTAKITSSQDIVKNE